MKTLSMNWMKVVFFSAVMSLFMACDNQDDSMGSGDVEFFITDAPSDDASIKGVFITVTDIKVDGKSVSGFTKQTIDVKAYNEGVTKLLNTTRLTAKTYSKLTLVLDNELDASGNAPGCYVLTNDDGKFKLGGGAAMEVTISKDWNVMANIKSSVVIDFDLRKSIRSITDASVRYSFVANDELVAAIRVMNQSKVGTVKGSYSDQSSVNGDKIIVYAYKKGSFNSSQETTAGDDGILFKKAVASAEVKQGLAGKTYKLAFLEEGEYELHFASYNKNVTTNRFVFQTLLKSETNGSVGGFITVQSGITITLASVITGTL